MDISKRISKQISTKENYDSGEHIIAANGNPISGDKSIKLLYPKVISKPSPPPGGVFSKGKEISKQNLFAILLTVLVLVILSSVIIILTKPIRKLITFVLTLSISLIIIWILLGLNPKCLYISCNTADKQKSLFSSSYDSKDASNVNLLTVDNIGLTFGRIMALGGDYYGDPKSQISDGATPQEQQERFLTAFNSLAKTSPPGQVKALLKVFYDIEIAAIDKALLEHKQPSATYPNDLGALNVASGGGTKAGEFISRIFGIDFVEYLPEGSMMSIATANWDHFAEGGASWRAYSAGHNIALKYASKATSLDGLNMAYAYDAFACHFLSDYFAAGHLRTPRKRLYNIAPGWIGPLRDAGSFYAKMMHDEDNTKGLVVSNNACYLDNKMGVPCNTWTMYGDSFYSDTVNHQNTLYLKQTLQLSVNNVYSAYVTKQAIFDPRIWLMLPNIDFLKHEGPYGSPSNDVSSKECILKGRDCAKTLGPGWKDGKVNGCLDSYTHKQCVKELSSEQRRAPLFFTDPANNKLWARSPHNPDSDWEINSLTAFEVLPTYASMLKGKSFVLSP